MGLFTTTTSLELHWVGASFSGLTGLAADCITDAENKVRELLAARYDVSGADWQTTTGTVPPVVETITKWLALGYLHESTARGSKESYARADRYIKKALDNIKSIMAGEASVLDSNGNPIADSDDVNPILGNTEDYAPTFNEDSQLNWEVDLDKLDDIADERD